MRRAPGSERPAEERGRCRERPAEEGEAYSADEEAEVAARLEDLGYI